MAGKLVICGTPIGNLGDASPRLAQVLTDADLIYAEDTRRARRLLDHLDVHTELASYFAGNERARAHQLRERLESGAIVALITDAGMPAVSDPGYSAVGAARLAGADIVVVPGPSAVTAAVAVSGLVGERFTFEGFLPHRSGERKRALDDLVGETRPMVFFSAPSRYLADISAMAGVFGAERDVTVSRELTKLHEEVWFGDLGTAVAEWTDRQPRGEFTIVVAGRADLPGSLSAAVDDVTSRVERGEPLSEAVRLVAAALGIRRRGLYEEVLRRRDGLA